MVRWAQWERKSILNSILRIVSTLELYHFSQSFKQNGRTLQRRIKLANFPSWENISAIDPNEYAKCQNIFPIRQMNDWSQRRNDQCHLISNYAIFTFSWFVSGSTIRASFYSHKYFRNIITVSIHFRFMFMLGIEMLVPMIRTVQCYSEHFMVNFNERIDSKQPNQIVNQLIELPCILHCIALCSILLGVEIPHISWNQLNLSFGKSEYKLFYYHSPWAWIDEHMFLCDVRQIDVRRELIY